METKGSQTYPVCRAREIKKGGEKRREEELKREREVCCGLEGVWPARGKKGDSKRKKEKETRGHRLLSARSRLSYLSSRFTLQSPPYCHRSIFSIQIEDQHGNVVDAIHPTAFPQLGRTHEAVQSLRLPPTSARRRKNHTTTSGLVSVALVEPSQALPVR
ncbi:hypothetical protein BDV18DRAFT_13099 [Aspergillus unguis]